MLSGFKNLAYIARGMRLYGEKPVLGRSRGAWEFQFILEGRARPTGTGAPLPLGFSPRLYVFHPGSTHGWTDDPGGVSKIFVVQFREAPEELGDRATPLAPLCLKIDKSELMRFTEKFETVWQAARGNGLRASLHLNRFLFELSAWVVERGDGDDARPAPADKVTRALHWMEENLGENPSVADAARAVAVSAAHLRRLFSQSGRPAPHEEFTRLRMEAARRCLLLGWKQAAVAQYLGFSEVSAFARAFRDACGRAPGAWLKTVRKTPARPAARQRNVRT